MDRPERPASPTSGATTVLPATTHLAGIGMMLVGIFLYVANDVLGKWLVASFGVGQILLIRSAAGLLMIAPLLMRKGGAAMLRPARRPLHLLRVLFSTAEVVCFYWAVVYLPLADTVTYYMAAPIYVTALAGPLLGEPVGWRRWIAVAAGFAGVVVALDPSGQGIAWASLIPLAGSLCFALLIIVSRTLRGTSDTVLVTWQTLGSLTAGLVLAPFQWVAPTGRDVALMACLGVVATLAHFAVNRSLKLAPAAVVVPYQYTQIVWAVLLGFLVFGDSPARHVVLGSAIIIAAGLYIFLREQQVAAAAKAAGAAR
jgi:drug/metabolite transporter (DMT)-like permease